MSRLATLMLIMIAVLMASHRTVAQEGDAPEDADPEAPGRPDAKVEESWGDPLEMTLPESVEKEMRDQGTAITRMRVYFEESDNEDGLSLEFDGMRTEVPVIYAAFLGEECDKALSYDEWLSRRGRYVDLSFEVETAPSRLKGMEVQIVHSHLQGENETELSTFEVTVPEDGHSWDSLRLRGARPGINRYTLQISYTNSLGEKSTHRGFSHWVIVQAPPMFQFLNDVTATATYAAAGATTQLNADVAMRGSFILHHGLDPEECELRITRQGRRDVDLSKLSPTLRRIVGKDRIPPGWQEVARVDLTDGTFRGHKVLTLENSFARLSYNHVLSATSAVLPLSEDWEYRFQLLHDGADKPLATWNVHVTLNVAGPEDISKARLKIRASGIDEPITVPFRRR